ncbi:MAG: hypothetical protein HYY50_01525 [Candidatus Kerfeldbacteria bacterium]|nr:hypothetical protein [Candidatus Kerfeldbacteria bacterium]
MPDVNLLRDTESPELPPKKPRRPGPPELTDPVAQGGGLSKFFQSFLSRTGRPGRTPTPAVGARRDNSIMGLGRSKVDQRIIKEETRAGRPTVIPLPEEEGLGVNLLAEELFTTVKPRERLIQLGVWTAGAVVLVGLAYVGLALAERSVSQSINSTRQELRQVESDVAALQDDQRQIMATTKKVAAIRSLIENHTRWTNFFAKLEAYTLPEVFYGTNFSGDINGQLTLSARTDSYENLAKQYLVFTAAVKQKDFISAFEISSASQQVTPEGTAVTFSVSLTVVPSVFANTSVASTTTDTADDSVRNP